MFKTIHRFETTTSTNDEAVRRAKEGAPEGEVFLAETQTQGRGRLGRPWESPKGKCLAFSLLLRPTIAPVTAPLLTLVAGASMHETILGFLPRSLKAALKIKWPNDVYLQGKKIGGILTESDAQGGIVRWIVIGVGIDVNADETDFSSEVRKIATSLQTALGRPVDRDDVLVNFLKAFERRYEEFLKNGFGATRDYIETHDFLNGKRVHAAEGSLAITGIVQGVSEDGRLRLKTDAGQIVSLVAGDVRLS